MFRGIQKGGTLVWEGEEMVSSLAQVAFIRLSLTMPGIGNGLTVDIRYSSTSFEDRVEDHLFLVIPGRLSARNERRDGELELIGADIRAWTLGRWNRALTGGGGSTNPSGRSKGRSTTRWVEEEAEAAEGDMVVQSSPTSQAHFVRSRLT